MTRQLQAPGPGGARQAFRVDWFLLGMITAAILAWNWPGPGARGGALHAEVTIKVGVALIFFLHGLALSFKALRDGILRWPVHAVVFCSTFLLFPLLGVLFLAVVRTRIDPDLALGFYFLCALPSTVSSSVALTAVAHGNVPAAVFNATLSNLLGVVLTPLWMSLFAKAANHALPMGSVILEIVQWLVVPLIAGQLLRPWLGAWAARHKPFIHLLDRGTILLLVYASLSDSVQRGVWTGRGLGLARFTLIGSIVIFVVAMLVISTVCRALRFSRADRITAFFCGSKKALTSGISMGQLMFAGHPGIGVILLPIMIYHPLQLFVGSIFAARWAAKAPVDSPQS